MTAPTYVPGTPGTAVTATAYVPGTYYIDTSHMPSTAVTTWNHGWNFYGYHAPKCVNCGYCPCCQRSDVQEQVDAVPGDGRDR